MAQRLFPGARLMIWAAFWAKTVVLSPPPFQIIAVPIFLTSPLLPIPSNLGIKSHDPA